MAITQKKLNGIKVLFCAPYTLAVYGIPYNLRLGQSPRDLWLSRTVPMAGSYAGHPYGGTTSDPGPRDDWIYLGSAGWFGSMTEEEQSLVRAFLLAYKYAVPCSAWEWSSIRNGDQP